MKSQLFVIGALVSVLAMPAFADSFKCGNDTDLSNARWYLQVSHSRTAGEGRVPAFFLLTNAKPQGTIVRTDDRRRIQLGGAGQTGTTYSVKLNAKEVVRLAKKADQRLDLKGASKVTLRVNFELNEDLEDGDTRSGRLSIKDEAGDVLYSTSVGCTYDDSTN